MASPMRAVAEVLSQLMHPNRAADIIRMADADPAFAAKLMAAVEADDFGKSLRMLVADAQWGAAPARQAPARAAAPAPLTTAQRMSRNPDIQSQIQDNLSGLPPELAQRIQAGDPDAAVEAYQMIAAADGELPRRAPQINDPESPDYIPDVDMMGFSSGSLADDGMAALIGGQAPPATRQMELPLGGQNELPQRGLVPFGVRGEGVPVGGPRGMGTARDVVGGMIPAPLRGIPGQTRGLSTDVLLRRLDAAQSPAQLPLGPALAARSQGLDRIAPFPQASRAPTPPPRSRTPERIAAAGAAGVGIGASVNQMMQGRNTDMSPKLMGDLDDSSMPVNMEELPALPTDLVLEEDIPVNIAEPPPPETISIDAPAITPEPVDYSLEARKLIDQLNAMRRQAGGEVPEAAKMQSEIQRLLDLGNKTRKATYAAAPQDDAGRMYQQAQGMIDQVNEMYRQGHSQVSPQVQKLMSEVRRLQSAGDAIRNRRSA